MKQIKVIKTTKTLQEDDDDDKAGPVWSAIDSR